MMKDKSLVMSVVGMWVLAIVLFVGGLSFMESYRHTTKETYYLDGTYRVRELTYDGFGCVVNDVSYPYEKGAIER